jgi:hypothetical protein
MNADPPYHMDAEVLERFAEGRAADDEAARVEEHLLLCDLCRQKLAQFDSFVASMRTAAAGLRAEPPPRRAWWTPARLIPALAGLALLALGATLISKFNVVPQAPVAIGLTATRGAGIEAHVPVGRALALTPDLTALPDAPAYRLEVVDEKGSVTWQGRYAPGKGAAAVPGQRAGTHFVRIYTLSGELLREYGLEVNR